MKTKEIFVLRDGCSVILGQKLPGFNYPIENPTNPNRLHHIIEMEEFFSYCKDYFKAAEEFKYIFSYNGKRLSCLHKLNSDEKIVIVGQSLEFQGIQEGNVEDVIRTITRSPCYRDNFSINSNKSPNLIERINSQFIFTAHKLNKVGYSTFEYHISKSVSPRKKVFTFNSKLGSFEKLKINLGDVSSKIDKTFPRIHEQGLKQLKKKYKFSEGELHRLYAKFKLLVLLSYGINPEHKISCGISRQSFIDYYGKSKELAYALGRVFDAFDSDRGGTVS